MILTVERNQASNCAQIAQAFRFQSNFRGFDCHWNTESDENTDDGNNREEFKKGECTNVAFGDRRLGSLVNRMA